MEETAWSTVFTSKIGETHIKTQQLVLDDTWDFVQCKDSGRTNSCLLEGENYTLKSS